MQTFTHNLCGLDAGIRRAGDFSGATPRRGGENPPSQLSHPSNSRSSSSSQPQASGRQPRAPVTPDPVPALDSDMPTDTSIEVYDALSTPFALFEVAECVESLGVKTMQCFASGTSACEAQDHANADMRYSFVRQHIDSSKIFIRRFRDIEALDASSGH